jgi:hypothetical protein
MAPRLMTDKKGIKFLRFATANFVSPQLAGTSTAGIDTFNVSTLMVGRFRTSGNPGNCNVVKFAAQNPHLCTQAGIVNTGSNRPSSTGTANIARLFVGEQLQVAATSYATDTGNPNGAYSTQVPRSSINEQSHTTGGNNGRLTAMTAVTVGGNGNFDLYELAIFAGGQFGTSAQMPTRHDAQVAKQQANFGIPAITENFVIIGDSRTVNFSDGMGNIATSAIDSGTLPATWRVITMGNGGKGIGWVQEAMQLGIDSNGNNAPTPLASGLMFGGGHDRMTCFLGINDLSGVWPNTATTPIAGTAVTGTVAHADDMYGSAANGTTPVYTTTFTGYTQGGNGKQVYYSAQAGGPLTQGMLLSGAGTGFAANTSVDNASASPAGLSKYTTSSIASPGVTITATILSYLQTVRSLYDLGWKISWGAEIDWGGNPYELGRAELNTKIMSNLIADVATLTGVAQATVAQRLNVYNLFAITSGGRNLFDARTGGVGKLDSNAPEFRDGTHPQKYGLDLLWNGADTPANGMSATVLALA